MTAPLPTPFDIVPPPLFPYAPGLTEWLVTGILALCGLVILAVVARALRPSGKLIAAINQALRELQALLDQALSPSAMLSAASLTCRRALGHLIGSDCSSMSANELEQERQNSPGPETAELLAALVEIERMRFASESAPARVRELVGRCKSSLEALRNARKTG